MKIINKEKPTGIPFGALISGNVFEYEGDFYIKTIGEEMVRLDDGQPDYLLPDVLVRPVEAVLTIS